MISQTLLFIIASIGITVIISISSIFSRVRGFIENKSDYFGELIQCPMCTGFWVGLVMSFVSFELNPIYGGAISSFMSWFAVSLVDMIQSVSNYFEMSVEQQEGDDT